MVLITGRKTQHVFNVAGLKNSVKNRVDFWVQKYALVKNSIQTDALLLLSHGNFLFKFLVSLSSAGLGKIKELSQSAVREIS